MSILDSYQKNWARKKYEQALKERLGVTSVSQRVLIESMNSFDRKGDIEFFANILGRSQSEKLKILEIGAGRSYPSMSGNRSYGQPWTSRYIASELSAFIDITAIGTLPNNMQNLDPFQEQFYLAIIRDDKLLKFKPMGVNINGKVLGVNLDDVVGQRFEIPIKQRVHRLYHKLVLSELGYPDNGDYSFLVCPIVDEKFERDIYGLDMRGSTNISDLDEQYDLILFRHTGFISEIFSQSDPFEFLDNYLEPNGQIYFIGDVRTHESTGRQNHISELVYIKV
jgi:hypothetical protein